MPLFLLYGFASLLAQVLLLREVALVFGAHELSLAAALACWLLWTAAGLRLARALPPFPFAAGALAFCAAAALNLALARLAPALLPALAQPGLASILAGSALLCLPAGLANGAAAAASLRSGPGRFYAGEAAGAALAGLFSIAYFRYFPGLEPGALIFGAALPLAAAAALPLSGRRSAAAAALLLACALGVYSGPRAHRLKPPAPTPERVAGTEGGRLAFARGSVYEDGRLLLAPEDEAPEHLVHVPLLGLSKPGAVLLHGAGAWAALPEVLRHKPASVEIAEPDRHKAAALAALPGTPKSGFAVLPLDPRSPELRKGRYCAVFSAHGAPENAAANRFYTAEFFLSARELLAPGGILVFQLPFAENYVPPAKAYAAACVLAAARAAFPSVEVLPGSRLTVLAGEKPPLLDPAALAAALKARGIRAKAVTPDTLPFILHPYRRAWASAELSRVKSPPVNSDLAPLAYFGFWRAWLSMVASPGALLGLAALALGALLAAWRAGAALRFGPGETGGEAFLAGFWALSFETALLLAFQSRTGRLAPELGALFALFMAGAAAGAWAARRAGRRTAVSAEAAALLLSLAAALAPGWASGPWPARLLLAAAGAASGAFFAGAAGRAGDSVYARDLAGAAAGGLAAAAFAAPLLGIAGTFYLSGAAALGALAGGLWRSSKESTVKE